jgi:hypothetical protein
MTIVARAYCNGVGVTGIECGAWIEFDEIGLGDARDREAEFAKHGWSRGRGYAKDGTRPRIDFCKRCTETRSDALRARKTVTRKRAGKPFRTAG